MIKILLTGAHGFIGKNIIESLAAEYSIVKVTRNSKNNILDLDSLLKINNIDIVVHSAAKTFIPDSFDEPYSFYDFNIKSTLNIAEFCRIKKIPKLIYFNSYCYGIPEYLPIDEKHRVSFHSPYNKSKFIAEELLFHYLQNITNVISLRIFNLYGKHQGNNFLIPTILNQVKNSNIVQINDLKPKRDYIYIKDLISLLKKIIKTENIIGVFNVGSGQSLSVDDIIKNIQRILNKSIVVYSNEIRRENEVMNCYADISKLAQALKWKPAYNITAGLNDYMREMVDA